MGLFDWIKSKNKASAKLAGGRGWTFDVVGESAFKHNLARIVGGKTQAGHGFKCEASLVHDVRNTSDPNAVVVLINGYPVAYLDRVRAAEYRGAIAAQSAVCGAKIVGGWDNGGGDEGSFGVKLNIKWPPQIA